MRRDRPTRNELVLAKLLESVKKILCCPPSQRLELVRSMLDAAAGFPQVDESDED